MLKLLEDILKDASENGVGLPGDLYTRLNLAIEEQRAAMVVGSGSTPIGEDEPVLMFRAQDKHFGPILRTFFALVQNDHGCLTEQKKAIHMQMREQLKRAEAWQKEHGCKSPDVPLPAGEAKP